MKLHFTLPTNNDFFNRYANLIPTLSKLGIISQLISALTEVGIIYSIILSRVYEIAPNNAELLATVGAIIGTAFLEIGLRKFTPYSIKAFLYQRFSGLDLAMTIFILLVCIGLFFGSAALSFNGSKELVKIATPTPQEQNTDKTDLVHQDKKQELRAVFVSDSATIANGYLKQIEAEKNRYTSLIEQQQSNLNRYTRKEQRSGLSYTTKKETIRGQIAAIKAEQAAIIANKETLQATELKALTTNRKIELKAVDSLYLTDITAIKTANQNTKDKAESTTLFYGNGLAWFTIICLCVFLFSVIIEEIHKKGSGIEQIALPNQYYFSESVLSDFINMLSDKVNFKLRNKIQNYALATPPPPVPIAPPNLYDLARAEQQRLIFTLANTKGQHYLLNNDLPQIDTTRAQLISNPTQTTNDLESKPEVTENSDLEQIILSYLNAFRELEKCNLHQQAKEIRVKADDVIKAYLGNEATTDKVNKLREQIIGFINGGNTNPFRHHHRQPIGFNKVSISPETAEPTANDTIESNIIKTAIRQPYNDRTPKDGQRSCLHCGTHYIYRQHTQKYCSEPCRIKAWQERTGKELKLKKKK